MEKVDLYWKKIRNTNKLVALSIGWNKYGQIRILQNLSLLF